MILLYSFYNLLFFTVAMYIFCVHICVCAYTCVKVSVFHCIYVDVRVQHVSINFPFTRSVQGIKFGQKIFRQTSLLGCPP